MVQQVVQGRSSIEESIIVFRKCWKDKKNRQESSSIIPAKTKLSFMKTNASECRNMTRCICMPPSLHTQKQQDIPIIMSSIKMALLFY
jgi:hypothetical protein